MKTSIVLFDGVCNFCTSSVQFIIQRDSAKRFQFASLQSKIGQELLSRYHISNQIDSVVLIEEETAFTESDAVLHICKHLDGGWRAFYPLILIPKPLRNLAYRWIAKKRYQWFGKQEACMLPTQDVKSRFLLDE